MPISIPVDSEGVISVHDAWLAAEGWIDLPVLSRAALAGSARRGPPIIQEYDSTCLVPSGWVATLDEFGDIRLIS